MILRESCLSNQGTVVPDYSQFYSLLLVKEQKTQDPRQKLQDQ